MRESFFMTSWVVSCLNGFKLKGWDLDKIFSKAKVDQDFLRHPTCAADTVNNLFETAATLYDSPAVGIEARKGITPNSFLSVSLAALASPNLAVALGQIVKFNTSMTNCVDIFLKEQKQRSIFGFTINQKADGYYPLIYDAVLSTTMKTCRFIQPNKPSVILVEMACPTPEVVDTYSNYFKAPIVWNADRYAIHFDTDYLNQPSIHFNQAIMEENERMASAYFASHEHGSFADEVVAYLYDANGSAMSLAKAAEYFYTGTRTMQRKLTAEGTSFCLLLEEVRKTKAKHLLENEKASVTEVAMELGFSDAGNFCRAFKRWFHCSPSQYQKSHQADLVKAKQAWLCNVG